MEPPLDPLSDVLASLNVRTGSLAGLDAAGGWALRFEVREHIKIGAVLTGSCWIGADGAPPVRLEAGDCFLLAARESFELRGDLAAPLRGGERIYEASPSRIVRLDGDDCEGEGEGDGADGLARTCVIGGSVNFLDSTVALLLSGLPPIAAIRAATPQARAIQPLFGLFLDEVSAVRLGASAMSERLTEMLFIQAMRALVEPLPSTTPSTLPTTPPETAPAPPGAPLLGWLGALGDPQIGGALLLMHQQTARPWTVAALGDAVGMSRAGFAARFRQLVGMPPLVYLQRWRILAAGRELRRGERTVASVAAECGYASESAFSNAFKRVTGVSPARYGRDPLAAAPAALADWPATPFRPHPAPR